MAGSARAPPFSLGPPSRAEVAALVDRPRHRRRQLAFGGFGGGGLSMPLSAVDTTPPRVYTAGSVRGFQHFSEPGHYKPRPNFRTLLVENLGRLIPRVHGQAKRSPM